MPLYKLLGGYRDRVPTYIAGGYYEEGKGLKELAEEMATNVEMGAEAVKMKIGARLDPRGRRAGARRVREAIGPDVKLMVDANCAYRYYEAIQIAKRIEEYDIFWFEEPVAPDDYEGHRKLAEATTHPDRHRRERVHPLRLPRPDRPQLGGDPQRRRQGPRRRDRVHEGGGAGAGPRPGHRAARLAGHPRPPGRGDPERPDPGVLPRHGRPDVGRRCTRRRSC